MEARATHVALATLACRAKASPRSGGRRPVPSARLQRLSLAARAARGASRGGVSHRKARQGLPEALGLVRLSPILSWGRRRARRASDQRDGLVATNKLVNVPDMVRADDNGHGRRPITEALPQFCSGGSRDERVKHQSLASRFNIGRRHDRLPIVPRFPVMMFRTPDPQASCHIAKFDLTSHRLQDILSDRSSS